MKMTETSQTYSNSPYISHSDQAEYERLVALAGTQGYGDTLMDDASEDLREVLGDLGYEVKDGG